MADTDALQAAADRIHALEAQYGLGYKDRPEKWWDMLRDAQRAVLDADAPSLADVVRPNYPERLAQADTPTRTA